MGIVSFAVGVLAVVLTFFEKFRLLGFIAGIAGIVLGVIAGYYKEKKTDTKESKALEVGSIIISGAACVSYLIFLWMA